MEIIVPRGPAWKQFVENARFYDCPGKDIGSCVMFKVLTSNHSEHGLVTEFDAPTSPPFPRTVTRKWLPFSFLSSLRRITALRPAGPPRQLCRHRKIPRSSSTVSGLNSSLRRVERHQRRVLPILFAATTFCQCWCTQCTLDLASVA